MSKYYPTIGLEIHAELKTNSKMFCSCPNDPFRGEPNSHICPVCTAHPGTLPVPNKTAIEYVIHMGLAVGGTIADFTEFDRKNYFYPDIPKGYQISQYKHPIVSGGELAGVTLTRIHLEEDTGTLEHTTDGALVDYNRAGVPLMELVTEPVIHSADQAMQFGREMQLLLRYLGISDANMEMGQMRVEANISLSPDPNKLGTKVEIKNLNSFSVVGKSIEYELKRMEELYESGRESEIIQETRGWDESTGTTKSQRTKENAEDYRYFPEPDIPKMYLHTLFNLSTLKSELPELPWEKRKRYAEQFGIKDSDIEFFILASRYALLFENCITELGNNTSLAQLLTNYIVSDLSGLVAELGEDQVFGRVEVRDLATLMQMNADNRLNSRATKDILRILATDGGDPETIATENNLMQVNDESALMVVVQSVIDENPVVVAEFKSGKEGVLMFLVGQVMKKSRGTANPETVQVLLREALK